MIDLFTMDSPLQACYASVYSTLSELRETFHRFGRLDDSNAKLDEVAKIFATYLAYKTGQIRRFPDRDSQHPVAELQSAFAEACALPKYNLEHGGSIFGLRPDLDVRAGDERMVITIVGLVRQSVDFAFDFQGGNVPFDVLNEAFGHFVRDNFRGNIEDAQYMTPPEVTDFVATLALHEVSIHGSGTHGSRTPITVLDPACGVGSFLGSFFHAARRSPGVNPADVRMFGQDKIERMVRLATLNLELFNANQYNIYLGNSLEIGSPLDVFNGKVDVVLTNPPFGAKFDHRYIQTICGDNTPLINAWRPSNRLVSSELLFVDRGLRFLRQGGHLFIILPDNVISSKGLAALLRHGVASSSTIRGIIELPSVTFAQAGTRTKTAILHIQKGRSDDPTSVFMSTAKNIGFSVNSRKGMQVKSVHHSNDLPRIADVFVEHQHNPPTAAVELLCSNPSCVAVPETSVLDGSWTPSHYDAGRFESIDRMSGHRAFELVPLQELVHFCSASRKPEPWSDGVAFISVRHIIGEGILNVNGVLSYAPKTPGIRVYPGEILISRINPQIPRVCIAPDFGTDTLCSSEFEIMKTRSKGNAFMLAYMLQTDMVQDQIRSLTTGTSASHNRIRTSDLGQVMVPIVNPATVQSSLIDKIIEEYQNAMRSITENAITISTLRRLETSVFDERKELEARPWFEG